MIAGERVRAAAVPGSFPLKVTIELTAQCNLRCPHCEFTPPRAWAEKHAPERIVDIGIEDLRRFAEHAFPYIEEITPSITGEPMMYPHWDEFLGLCAEHDVFLAIWTNGSYLTEKSLRRLGPRTSKLRISMDGASRETFEMLRKPAKWDDMMQRFAAVRSFRRSAPVEDRPPVEINSVLTLQWIDELPDMVRLAAEYEFDGVGATHLISYTDYWRKQHPSADRARTDAALREARRVAEELGVSVHLPRLFETGEDLSWSTDRAVELVEKVPLHDQPAEGRFWCHYLWRELIINSDGSVAPCCGPHRPYVGNIRDNFDLSDIFSSTTLQQMRTGFQPGEAMHPVCAKCPHLVDRDAKSGYGAAQFDNDYSTLDSLLGGKPSE